jgi:hypothetical protein
MDHQPFGIWWAVGFYFQKNDLYEVKFPIYVLSHWADESSETNKESKINIMK